MGCERKQEHLTSATLEHFGKIPLEDLKSFIITRCPQYKNKSKLPNKGTVQEAKNGSINLISIAFECRTQAIYDKYAPTISNEEPAAAAKATAQEGKIPVYQMQEI